MDSCVAKARKVFFNYYNRPNLTPVLAASVERSLEGSYPAWRVRDALEKLEEDGVLDSMEVGTGNGTKALFYFPSKIISSYDDEQKVVSKMRRMVAHLDKHSHPKVTGILARHLHALVKNELRAQGFKILFERGAKYHGSRGRTGAGHKVDLRAEHLQKKIAVGVMVRNELDLMDRAELDTILESCRELDVTPILACRWLAPYREEINKSGFLWQFRAQLYPLGFEALAETMRKKFRFPSMVATEIPARPAREFEAWLAGINGT